MKQRMTAHSKKVSELLGAMRLTVSGCADIGSKIDDKMEMIYKQMREIVYQIQKNAYEMKNAVEPVLLASEKNVLEAKTAIIDSMNAHQITVNEQKALFSQPNLSDNLKSMQVQLKNTVEQRVMLAHDSLKKATANNTLAMEQSQKCVDNIATNLPSKRDIIEVHNNIPSLRNDVNGNELRVFDDFKENSAALDKININTQQISEKVLKEINACHDHLKNFREKDFSEYKPSGKLLFFNAR